MLSVQSLSKNFGTLRALDRVSLDVPRNTIAGIIGPNGAGKTTLLLGMAGLLPMDNGRLYWEDQFIPDRTRSRILFYIEDAIRPHAQLPVDLVMYFCRISYRPSTASGLCASTCIRPFQRHSETILDRSGFAVDATDSDAR